MAANATVRGRSQWNPEEVQPTSSTSAARRPSTDAGAKDLTGPSSEAQPATNVIAIGRPAYSMSRPTIVNNQSRRFSFLSASPTATGSSLGATTDRERATALRSVSHLRKDERSPLPEQSGSRSVDARATLDGESSDSLLRPFHHSEMAQPPMYFEKRSGRRPRMSLDVRRPTLSSILADNDEGTGSSTLNMHGSYRGNDGRLKRYHGRFGAFSQSHANLPSARSDRSPGDNALEADHSQDHYSRRAHTLMTGLRLQYCLNKLGLGKGAKGKKRHQEGCRDYMQRPSETDARQSDAGTAPNRTTTVAPTNVLSPQDAFHLADNAVDVGQSPEPTDDRASDASAASPSQGSDPSATTRSSIRGSFDWSSQNSSRMSPSSPRTRLACDSPASSFTVLYDAASSASPSAVITASEATRRKSATKATYMSQNQPSEDQSQISHDLVTSRPDPGTADASGSTGRESTDGSLEGSVATTTVPTTTTTASDTTGPRQNGGSDSPGEHGFTTRFSSIRDRLPTALELPKFEPRRDPDQPTSHPPPTPTVDASVADDERDDLGISTRTSPSSKTACIRAPAPIDEASARVDLTQNDMFVSVRSTIVTPGSVSPTEQEEATSIKRPSGLAATLRSIVAPLASAAKGIDEEQASLDEQKELQAATEAQSDRKSEEQRQSSTDSGSSSATSGTMNRFAASVSDGNGGSGRNGRPQGDGSASDGRNPTSGPSRRPIRSSSKLSHLPRLDSARNTSTLQNSAARSGDGGRGNDSSRDANRASEEPPSDDETLDNEVERAEEEGETDTDDDSLESGDEDDDDSDEHHSMPGSMPMSMTSSAAGEGRQSRRPSGIALPPAPTFSYLEPKPSVGPAPIEAQETEEAAEANAVRDAANDTFVTPTATGRHSWMQFKNADETPGWLPTPRASAGPSAVGSSLVTPRMVPSSLANIDASYFNIEPSASASSSQQQTMRERNPPPPSPSIITRSRAQSSAGSLSMRTPTLPSRELPSMPPVAPLNLRSGGGANASANAAAGSNQRKATNVPAPIVASPFASYSMVSSSASPSSSSAAPTATSARPSSPFSYSLAESSSTSVQPSLPSIRRPSTSSSAIEASLESAPAYEAEFERFQIHADDSLLPSPSRKTAAEILSAQARPGLYKQESRSLIDLTSSSRKQIEPMLRPLQHQTPPQLRDPRVPDSGMLSPASIDRATSPAPSTSRRRSMFEVGAAPPPYSVAHRGPDGLRLIYPREEEGREQLPGYACSVHIEGYLPRKMEFSSPGVQAKDRSWKRQYFVLHGTCLRVYRTDLSNERAAAKGQYGSMSGHHIHLEPMNEDGPTVPSSTPSGRVQGVDSRVPISKDVVPSSTASSGSPTHNRSTSQATAKTSTSDSAQTSSNNHGHNIKNSVEAALNGTISHINHPFSIHRGALVKQYTLQGAESGLAADYLKRRHVVRVRAEGEQFLLQTRNDRHVVDWIEAFQASTNVSLDLERRPMPKFITLPRRRRRRRRDGEQASGQSRSTAAATNGLSAREAADLEEARRRSLAEVGSSTSSHHSRRPSNLSSSMPAPRPLGLPGDATPPSAFEEMMRQEQEDSSSRDAGDV